MTSLARQLKRLAVNSEAFAVDRDLEKCSLIFDPKQAASIDLDDFYEIGISGLDDLEKLDPSFQQFRDSLFHLSSKTLQRAILQTEKHEELQSQINKFLNYCVPWFQLECTKKALEWLVQRFRIHFYDVNALVQASLPSHDSPIFVKIIKIINFDKCHKKWKFLEDYAKEGVQPTKTALMKLAIDLELLQSSVDLLNNTIEIQGPVNSALDICFSYVSSLCIGCMNHVKFNDKHVTLLLSVFSTLFDSEMKSGKLTGFFIASYLLSKHTLEKKIVLKILAAGFKKVDKQVCTVAVQTLALSFQQKQLNGLSKKLIKYLCNIEKLSDILNEIGNIRFTSFIIQALIEKACEDDDDENLTKTIKSLIKNCSIQEKKAACLIIILFKHLTKDKSSMNRPGLLKLLQVFEKRFSAAFDIAIYVCDELQGLHKILNRNTLSDKPDCAETSLTMNIFHTSAIHRVTGIQTLKEMIQTNAFLDEKLLSYVIYNKLDWKEEGQYKVISALLDLTEKFIECRDKLKSIFDASKLTETLFKVCLGCDKQEKKSKMIKIYEKSLMLLSHVWQLDDNGKLPMDMQIKFFSLFIINSNEFHKLLIEFCKQHRPLVCFELQKFLKSINLEEILKPSENLNKIAEILLKNKTENSILSYLRSSWKDKSDFQFLLSSICQNMFHLCKTRKDWEYVWSFCAELLEDNFDLSGVDKTVFDEANLEIWLDIYQEEELVKVSKIFCILSSVASIKAGNLGNFMSPGQVENELRALRKFSALGCIKKMKKKLTKVVHDLMMENVTFGVEVFKLLPALKLNDTVCENFCIYLTDIDEDGKTPKPNFLLCLILLLSPDSNERSWSISTLKAIKKNLSSPWKKFFEYVLEFTNEIIVDQKCIISVMKKYLAQHRSSAFNEGLKSLFFDKDTWPELRRFLTILVHKAKSTAVNEILIKLNDSILKTGSDLQTTDIQTVWLIIKKFIDCGVGLESIVKTLSTPFACAVLPQLENIEDDELQQSFKSLKNRQEIITAVLDVAFFDFSTSETRRQVQGFLTKMDLTFNEVEHEFNCLYSKDGKSLKERRMKDTEEIIIERLKWIRISILLQALCIKDEISDWQLFLPCLFKVLHYLNIAERQKDTIEYKTDLDFNKQLVLTLLNSLCTVWASSKNSGLKQESVAMDDLLLCLRSSSNLHIRQQALLVLTSLAELYPDYIVNNLLSLLSFMGEDLLPQMDDEHSLKVVENTVRSLLPVLERFDKQYDLLRVIVQGRKRVPSHRRQALYSELFDILNIPTYLPMFIAMLSEDICKTAIKRDDLKKTIENEINLIFEKRQNQCKPEDIADACLGILEFTGRFAEGSSSLPVKPSKLVMKQKREYFFPVVAETLSVNQLCYILMSSVFSCHYLLEYLSSFKLEDEASDAFTLKCSNLIEVSAKLTSAFLSYVNVKDSSIPTSFWLSLQSLFKDDNMGKVMQLLDAEQFSDVLKTLLSKKDDVIIKKMNNLAPIFLRSMSRRVLTDAENSALKNLLVTFSKLIDSSNQIEKITAYVCLRFLSKMLTPTEANAFKDILKKLIKHLKTETDKQVIGNIFMCAGEIMHQLGATAIVFLSEILESLFLHIESVNDLSNLNVQFLTACLNTLARICMKMIRFLGPFLERLLKTISKLSAYKTAKNTERLNLIKDCLVNNIEIRVILPVLKQHADAHLLEILLSSVEIMNVKDIATYYSQIVDVVCAALESQTESLDISSRILYSVAMKSRQDTFKAILSNFVSWATVNEEDIVFRRKKVLLQLTSMLAGKLRSAFTRCAAPIWPLIMETLEGESESVENALKTVAECVYYEQDVHLDDRTIGQLVTLITNKIGKGDTLKALSGLAVAKSADSKKVVEEIVSKFTEPDPNIKISGMKTIGDIANKMGGEFLDLMPDIVPSLHELMEDDDEDVTKAVHKILTDMEESVGQDLQTFFSG
ncbi:DgyrCDS1292 [Dimorphilus gyrociliatus]|uniref:HEAT repeat-containing protein 1 n=1 Tax=Dimorphilus gyrociliatus TaxID=2664684 RepID=A0A7I8V6U5_9ANNE|nr:DgyrCDS1292 [Dimorphilus gyrociliatus]